MIPEKLLPGYSAWTQEQTGERLRLDQYIGCLLDKDGPASSLVVSLLTLAAPQIYEKDSHVFVEEFFSPTRFDELRAQGKAPGEIEYWMNLLGVSAIFDVLSDSQCEYIARALQQLWTFQLTENALRDHECRLIFDDDEWYITICRKSAFPESGSSLGANHRATKIRNGVIAKVGDHA
jgi:hypothetical protein